MLTGIFPALERGRNKCTDRVGIFFCEILGAENHILKHCNALVVHIYRADLVAVAVAAVIVVFNKTELVICHGRCQGNGVGIKLIHCEVHADIIGRLIVFCEQCLDFIFVAQSPVAYHTGLGRRNDSLLVGHFAGLSRLIGLSGLVSASRKGKGK